MVEFKLTKEQLLAKELFRSFAENEIKPISRDMDEAEKFDMDLLDKMKKYGLMGIPYSKEYGGEGADVLTYALAMEEVSKVDASAGIKFPYILLFAVLVLTTMHQKNRNRNSYVH